MSSSSKGSGSSSGPVPGAVMALTLTAMGVLAYYNILRRQEKSSSSEASAASPATPTRQQSSNTFNSNTGNSWFAFPPSEQQRPQNSGRGGFGRGGGNASRGGGEGRGGGGAPRACFKCGEEGHMSRECPQQAVGGGRGGGGEDGGSRACFKCGEKGHMPRHCPHQAAREFFGRDDGSGAEFKAKFDIIIREFIENDDVNELTLPSTLTPKERHSVHELAIQYGLDHASSGPKEARTLTITKPSGIRATA